MGWGGVEGLEGDLGTNWYTESNEVGAMVRSDGLVIVVHGVEWLPASRMSLLAAKEVQEELSKRKKGRIKLKMGFVDSTGDWKWARKNGVVAGTPTAVFYHDQKRLHFNVQGKDTDALTGPFSSTLLHAYITRTLDAIQKAPRGSELRPIDLTPPTANLDVGGKITRIPSTVNFAGV